MGNGSPVPRTNVKRERSPLRADVPDNEERAAKRPTPPRPPASLSTTTAPLPSPPPLLVANSFHSLASTGATITNANDGCITNSNYVSIANSNGIPGTTPIWTTAPTSIQQTPASHQLNNTVQRSAFEHAAEEGAREARSRTTNSEDTFTLGVTIVRRARLSAAQRRSSRVLPGGGDTTTAACHALGGTSDHTLNMLASAVSPTQPRDSRLKAVERKLKSGIRASIVRLNGGDATREARASNLAAVRICTSVADIMSAYSAQMLVEDLERAKAESVVKDATIAALRAQLEQRCNCKRR